MLFSAMTTDHSSTLASYQGLAVMATVNLSTLSPPLSYWEERIYAHVLPLSFMLRFSYPSIPPLSPVSTTVHRVNMHVLTT